MFTTHLLQSVPRPKFVLVRDNVKQNGTDIFAYLICSHLKSERNVVYCEFELNRHLRIKVVGNMERLSFVNGLTPDDDEKDCKRFLQLATKSCVLVVDSVGHMVYRFGLRKTYNMLHTMRRSNTIQQILMLLHSDLFGEGDDVFASMEQLATFGATLLPGFSSQLPRISYLYQKPGGKVITSIEQYEFKNGALVTSNLEKLDMKKLVAEKSALPESLTTFKIGLSDKDKESRGNLVLPYLPKEEAPPELPGEIHYVFDEVDDWDEEDPDDDLDI